MIVPKIYAARDGATNQPCVRMDGVRAGRLLATITLSGHKVGDMSQVDWANLVARAVNNHADLLAALKFALRDLELARDSKHGGAIGLHPACVNDAKSAIFRAERGAAAKAEGLK